MNEETVRICNTCGYKRPLDCFARLRNGRLRRACDACRTRHQVMRDRDIANRVIRMKDIYDRWVTVLNRTIHH